MFYIGICDDSAEDRRLLREIVEQVIPEISLECRLLEFSSGDRLYEALSSNPEMQIDLLFLDIEMDGVDGLGLRDLLVRNEQVWRIVFVSNHEESMADAFGLKTIGFIGKPAKREQAEKKIRLVVNEYNNNLFVELPSAQQGNRLYRIERIAYFLAEGNYSRVFLLDKDDKLEGSELICCKLIDVEQKCNALGFLRIHKSYYVNMEKIVSVAADVNMCDKSLKLPIGRKYKEQVKDSYFEFVLKKAKDRM